RRGAPRRARRALAQGRGGIAPRGPRPSARLGRSVSEETKKKRPKRADAPDSRTVALAVVEAGLDKKALNAEIIDVRGKVDYADYVVVMSGRSDRQVNAI